MRQLLLAVACLAVAGAVPATEISSDDLEAFADGLIYSSMEDDHVPGVTLGVVAEGKIVLLKGYGDADALTHEPVDPETTLFRPGSVTKLFTWVALMQLKEQGKIDLDTDVNAYLEGVRVPDTFVEPITITHLMTHTPGFEDHVLGLFGRDETSLRPFADLLNEEMPLRVRPPGTYASYSNHGVAIAGLIVEQVSGEPWAQYIDDHVLTPLDMQYTTMRQPLPVHLAANMSKGYAWSAGKYVAKDFEFVPAAPAGSSSASAGDLMHLAIAFLGDGSYEGGRILSPEANREMQEVLFRPIEGSTGLAHGFYESSSHGQRIIGHGGDTLWFHSELALLPDAGVGWFISTNSAAGPKVRATFRREFLDRYFGRPVAEQATFEKTDIAKLVGKYGAVRHAYDDFTKLIALISAATVSATDGGELMLTGGGEPAYFIEESPGIFKARDGEARLGFLMGDDGMATHMYMASAPVVAFERLTGIDSPVFQQSLIGFAMFVFLWILVVWTVQRFNRRFVLPQSVARLRLFGWWLALSMIAFLMGLSVVISDPNDVVFGLTTGVKVVLLIPYVVLVLALSTVVLCPSVLREDGVGRLAKFGYLLVAAAAISITWFLYYWQLI